MRVLPCPGRRAYRCTARLHSSLGRPGRIGSVDANTRRLDAWFEQLERVPLAEKFRVEVVGGNVHMTPQRTTHWEIIRTIAHAVEDRVGRDATIFSNVRIDFPGPENGFCPDVALLSAAAEADPYQGRCHIFTHPKDGDYTTETRVVFGEDLDLTGTVLGLTLRTDVFPRD
ncbi:Uma2 family endonuclease [Streptomyces sp. NPDC005549]|uniref:Uma2 family endonuclease n=1 Tax=Streptomyces sp. NPDC005549 TaxID=3154888 RepID=UPI0033BC5845